MDQEIAVRRVLVLTNHFVEFSGSEVVSLEVARWFHHNGCEVTFVSNHIADPVAQHAADFTLADDVETIDLRDYDLVWCQHDMLALLPFSRFEQASQSALPHIAMASLSPYEPYEHVDSTLARALSADIFVNSPETRDETARRSHGDVLPEALHVFHNAAPTEFWTEATDRAPTPNLHSLLVISNHAPPELLSAVQALTAQGHVVRHVGLGHDYQLLTPADILAADAVITIGKSVPYAIALQRPVYLYDHFGGDGWLTRDNFAANMAHNFSGRPHQRQLESPALVREITEGYAGAREVARGYGDLVDLDLLSLDQHLRALVARALAVSAHDRAANLADWLARPQFRAHLETCRQKALIARRAYLAQYVSQPQHQPPRLRHRLRMLLGGRGARR